MVSGHLKCLSTETDLCPRKVLARTSKIEHQLGRRRMAENGPRTIDIDILFYGNFVVDTTELTFPHPRFSGRGFVLAHMVALAPELRDPVSRRTMRELVGGTAGQAVNLVDADHRATILSSDIDQTYLHLIEYLAWLAPSKRRDTAW